MSFREAVTRWQRAVRAGATDLYLVPVFGVRAELQYENGHLVSTPDRKLKGYRRRICADDQTAAGLEVYRHLRILGYVENGWFCASEIRVQSDCLQPPVSRVIQLHVLAAKGFSTVMPLCSWAAVNGVDAVAGGATTRVLDADAPTVQKGLRKRLQTLRDVLAGRRPSYWQSATLYPQTRKFPYGKRCLPFTDVLGLEVAEAVGIEFENSDCDFPRLW